MTDTVRDRIAEILRQHQITDTPTWANERICSCGATIHTMIRNRDHFTHMAEQIIIESERSEPA